MVDCVAIYVLSERKLHPFLESPLLLIPIATELNESLALKLPILQWYI